MVGWDFFYLPLFPTRVFAFVCVQVPTFFCGREETLAHSSSLAKEEWETRHKMEEPQRKKGGIGSHEVEELGVLKTGTRIVRDRYRERESNYRKK